MATSTLDLRAMYAEYYDMLVAFLVNRNCHCAEDIVQEVFVKLIDYPNPIRDVRAFLYTAAVNLHRNVNKMEAGRGTHSLGSNGDGPTDRVDEYGLVDCNVLSRLDQATLLARGMRVLNDKEREAIEAVYLDDLGLDTAAAKLGMSYAALQSRAHRAVLKMRQSLKESA
jgi:RNA polymerase sigma factor (sigma-70 family)